ncbi:serine/threonine-protein kinase [Myceligenerans crystallogenes]|uniref:Protein kinase domain-containing protein n=1 Tax=Myceligenerans crystallogenes TaxID=316335 RepID=A0ABN2NAN3_9MICO
MPEPLRPNDPRRIGPYSIEARLGAGGMGNVYLGRTTGGFWVAVKVAKQEIADDPGFRRRFADEVRNAKRVDGLYTAAVHDSDVDADQPWVATEYVDAPTLAEYVERNGALPPGAVARLGAGIAEGLAAVHSKGILHRDLKPQNVLVTGNGPKVIDFGIARAMEETSHTPESKLVGTAAYMSPEQAMGSKDVGYPSDIHAFGAVLFYAATGHNLWGTGQPLAILRRVAHDEPDLSEITHPLLGVLLKSCLAKTPGARPGLDTLRRTLEPFALRGRPEDVTDVVAGGVTVPIGEVVRPGGAPGPGPGATPGPGAGGGTRPRSGATPVVAGGRPDGAGSAPPVLPPGRGAPVAREDPAPERFALTTAGMRCARVATYLGRILLLPLAVVAGAFLFQQFAYPPQGEGAPATTLVNLLPTALLLGLIYVTTRSRPRVHDRIELSADGIRVLDRRLLRLKDRTFFVPWMRLERARVVVEDDLCAVVVRFPQTSAAPVEIWGARHALYRHRLGYVLTWIRIRTPQQTATVRKLRDALERFAGLGYIPVSR